MYAQMLTYRITNKSEEVWQVESERFAPVFAALPGLVRTLWFADVHTFVYGTLFFWSDAEARDAFIHSAAFRRVARHPDVRDVALQEFDVWDYHTRLTARLAAGATAADADETLSRTA